MSRIGLAFRAFFGVLWGTVAREPMQTLLAGTPAQPPSAESAPGPPVTAQPPTPPSPRRNEAITLLAALQREARLVDLIQEPLSDYTDEQIGAAARDVLRDSREVLARMFALRPVLESAEDERVETPAEFSAGRFRVGGNVTGQPPFRGRLVHHGWEATRCDLPNWTGDEDAARIITPAEIEC